MILSRRQEEDYNCAVSRLGQCDTAEETSHSLVHCILTGPGRRRAGLQHSYFGYCVITVNTI